MGWFIEEAAVRLSAFIWILFLASVVFAQGPPAAQKPLNKDQVMTLVTAGMDNEQLAKRIEERGIDFEPTDDYIEALRKAGAQDVLIRALRPAKTEPMNRQQVVQLVAGGVPAERATALVKQRGIDFVPDNDYLETLRVAGADETLIAAVREAGSAIPGKLEVATAPSAEVYLDGALAGRADSGGTLIVDKVKSGAHTLRVTLAMKKDFEQSVTVTPGAVNKVAATLASLPSKLVINSTAGAEVFLDDVSRGKTDASGELVIEGVAPGSAGPYHQLKVTGQINRKDYFGSVKVEDGQEVSAQAFGEPAPGSIRVRATPGARVFLDALRPLVVYANGEETMGYVSPGAHQVRVAAEGQADFRSTVVVESGQVATLDAPRRDPSTSGKRTDRLYRSLAPSDGYWFYLRFFSDGTVTVMGSKESLADAERAIQENKSKCLGTYVYEMQGSTLRYATNGMLGVTEHTATVRGSKLSVDMVGPTGERTSDVYQAVDSESAAKPRRR